MGFRYRREDVHGGSGRGGRLRRAVYEAVLNGHTPPMPIEIALMDRLHCSYQGLMDTPNWLVDRATMIIKAESEAADTKNRWKK